MRKSFLILILTTAALCAESIQFTGLPINTSFGTYNGFANATVNGIAGQLICDDYDHTTYFPSGPLTYAVSTLVDAVPLEFARFADPLEWHESIARYEQAALLLDGLLHTGPGYLLDLTAEYQYALWHLFTPTVRLPNDTARLLFNESAQSVQVASARNMEIYSRLLIYTPRSPFESNQEFLAMSEESLTPPPFTPLPPPTGEPIPEPSVWTMMSIGIALLLLGAKSGKLRALLHAQSATTSSSPRESEP